MGDQARLARHGGLMKTSRIAAGLAAALGGLCAAGVVHAGDNNVMADAARAVDSGRSLEVVLAQAEIKSNINESNITMATGGGLLPALIDAKINSDRAKKAEREILPVREALTGFDVDALATDATQKATDKLDWFQARPAVLSRDPSVAGESAALDASPTSQMAFFEYAYDLSPDFGTLRVSLKLRLVNKATSQGGRPQDRFKGRNLVFTQKFTSVVPLPGASKDAMENAGRWSADNGKLARAALTQAFDKFTVLVPRALTMSAADLKAMNGHDKKVIAMASYSGRVQEQSADETLIYNSAIGGLIDVQTLAP